MTKVTPYLFESIEEQNLKILVTSLLPPQRSTEIPAAEGINAVKKINQMKGQKKLKLFLDETFESLATLESFLKANIEFSVTKIKIKNGSESPHFIKKICADNNILYEEMYFDFTDSSHLRALDFLAEKMKCNYLTLLFQMWAVAQCEEFSIFPGWFTFPTTQYSTLDEYGYNLPGYFEMKLTEFYAEYDGVPSFLSSTAELANSFLLTEIAKECIYLNETRNDLIDFTEEVKEILFTDSGFLLNPSGFKPAGVNIAKEIRKINSVSVRKYESLKYYKLILDSPYQYHRQKINITIPPALGLRDKTKKLIPAFEGGAVAVNTPKDALNKQYLQQNLAVFPELISTFQYDQPLDEVITFVKNLPYYANLSNSLTESDLHLKPELKSVVDFMKYCVRLYIERLGHYISDFEITQCWATKTTLGQSHPRHAHPNCFISGVFYLNDGGGGNIVFYSPTSNKRIEPEVNTFTEFNQGTLEIKPKIGRLILFNSEIRHSTKRHMLKDSRVSIAFNVWPRGQLGSFTGYAWTFT